MDALEFAEDCVVGSVLHTQGRTLEEVTLNPEDFNGPKHEHAWRLMREMWARGQKTDLVTVGTAALTADDITKRLVTTQWLHEAMANTPTAGNADYYASIVRDAAMRRRLKTAATRIAQSADEMDSISDLIEMSRNAIDQAAHVDTTAIPSMAETVQETIDEMSQPPRFVPTPWNAINHLIAGWRPGALYVIGARPGSGKTLMGVQSAAELARRGSVLICTLEMSRGEIHKRIFSQQMKIPLGHILDSTMTPEEWERVTGTKDRTWESIFINDDPSQTVEGIRTIARSLHRRRPLSAIVVDYLQLMEGHSKREIKRHELIGQWTRQLKIMAKKFDVPVIALSQLNRESARGAMPTLADLRESGSIEQDADVVMLLDRNDDFPDDLNVLVAKNRHGMRDSLTLDWKGTYAMIEDRKFRPRISA